MKEVQRQAPVLVAVLNAALRHEPGSHPNLSPGVSRPLLGCPFGLFLASLCACWSLQNSSCGYPAADRTPPNLITPMTSVVSPLQQPGSTVKKPFSNRPPSRQATALDTVAVWDVPA